MHRVSAVCALCQQDCGTGSPGSGMHASIDPGYPSCGVGKFFNHLSSGIRVVTTFASQVRSITACSPHFDIVAFSPCFRLWF